MGVLSGLKPEPVFHYFEEICGIPHTSHHEKALSDYCVRFAEVVLTVCEEVGLLGAAAMDLSPCKARRMLNIDSEVEGILTAGCAGGRRTCCRIPVERAVRTGLRCRVELNGLAGGHSGMEIDKGRANGAALLGRFLMLLKKNISYGLVTLAAGAKENVIPKSGSAVILILAEEESDLKKAAEKFSGDMEAEYGRADPGIRLELTVEETGECPALSEESLNRVLTALNLMPNGVQAMSMDLPGLVETSINMGVVELGEEELIIRQSIRSSVASAKKMISGKVALLAEQLGGRVEFQGDYPAWPYARASKLRDLCVEIFKEQYGHEPKIELIHAGLECGILSGKLEGLECISFGPNQLDIHTPDEHLSISSAARVWEYLKAILAAK